MALKSKGRIILRVCLFLILKISLFGCFNKKNYCYKVSLLNLAIEEPGTESFYYSIKDKKIINEIIGEKIIDEYYENNIKSFIVINDNDTIDNYGTIRTKMINNELVLIYRTIRFHKLSDTNEILKKISSENLLIELNNRKKFVLNHCDN